MITGGRIRDEDVEEVRRRANLTDVAAEYMQLKRAGRLFKALCPFHAEKTPSFSLDPAKGLYFCHGCHEGGDVIQLLRKLEGLSFVETIERLAHRYGVDLRYEQMSASDRAAMKRRMRLVDAHRAAAEHFHEVLKSAPEAADARRYLLQERHFSKETLEAFQVGFSLPRRDELHKRLAREGFSPDELVEAGLALRTEDDGLIDRFRGRVMFPILDVTGNHVAFGARRMGDGDGPKYLNSAESPIYKKSHVLYALHRAKTDVVKHERALIVEGYTDVIALHQAGITEAVATCGTALGIDHLRSLQRFTQRVTLSLDADEAGANAAERMYEQLIGDAQQMGLQVKVLIMPRGQDPADTVNTEGGDAFRAMADRAVPLLEFVLQREAGRYAVGDPEVRARALAGGLRLLAKTDNEVVRNEYARRLSDWIKVDPNIIHLELDKVMRSGAAPGRTSEVVLKRSSAQVRLEREALKLAIQYPAEVKPFIDEIGPEYFHVPAHRTIWLALASGAEPVGVAETLGEDDRKVFTELAVQPVAGEVTERLVSEIVWRLKDFVLGRHIEELKGRLQRLNPTEHPAEYDELFGELIRLEGERRRLGDRGEE